MHGDIASWARWVGSGATRQSISTAGSGAPARALGCDLPRLRTCLKLSRSAAIETPNGCATSLELDRQAAILRGLGAGRLPRVAAQVLRELRIHGKGTALRVVGTNAIYAYEALAGVMFEVGATATGDIDLLLDDRQRMRLITDEREVIGIKRLIQERVDKSFQPRRCGRI